MIFFHQWLNKYTFIGSLWQFTNFDFEQFMKFDNFSELQNVISDSIIQPSVYIKQIFKKHLAFLVLIGCLYFLVHGHGLSPWPQFPTLAPNSYLPALVPNLYLPALASNLHLLVLAPNLYLPALAYNFINSPGPEFAYTNLVSSICICIYGPGLRFAWTVRSLNMHLPYC